MGVTLFFVEKNLTTFESDDLFSCRLLTTSIFPRRLSSVLFKFSHIKLILGRVSPLEGVTRGGPPPTPLPLVTPLVAGQKCARVSLLLSVGTLKY